MHIHQIREQLRQLGAGPGHEERVLRLWATAQAQEDRKSVV